MGVVARGLKPRGLKPRGLKRSNTFQDLRNDQQITWLAAVNKGLKSPC
jgi:hypothetical protein